MVIRAIIDVRGGRGGRVAELRRLLELNKQTYISRGVLRRRRAGHISMHAPSRRPRPRVTSSGPITGL